jgi:hypothetical protein
MISRNKIDACQILEDYNVYIVGFVVDEVALGQVFSEYFGFPCQS